jgi:hypothetical protein
MVPPLDPTPVVFGNVKTISNPQKALVEHLHSQLFVEAPVPALIPLHRVMMTRIRTGARVSVGMVFLPPGQGQEDAMRAIEAWHDGRQTAGAEGLDDLLTELLQAWEDGDPAVAPVGLVVLANRATLPLIPTKRAPGGVVVGGWSRGLQGAVSPASFTYGIVLPSPNRPPDPHVLDGISDPSVQYAIRGLMVVRRPGGVPPLVVRLDRKSHSDVLKSITRFGSSSFRNNGRERRAKFIVITFDIAADGTIKRIALWMPEARPLPGMTGKACSVLRHLPRSWVEWFDAHHADACVLLDHHEGVWCAQTFAGETGMATPLQHLVQLATTPCIDLALPSRAPNTNIIERCKQVQQDVRARLAPSDEIAATTTAALALTDQDLFWAAVEDPSSIEVRVTASRMVLSHAGGGKGEWGRNAFVCMYGKSDDIKTVHDAPWAMYPSILALLLLIRSSRAPKGQ